LRPRGKRRPGGPGNRWADDFNYAGWKTQVEDDLIILRKSRAGRGWPIARRSPRTP
jgi:hypothetical protein